MTKSFEFKGSLNFLDFEKSLFKNNTLETDLEFIIIDLSEVSWVGILSISILYGWISSSIKSGKKIKIKLPESSAVNSFLASTKFLNELSKIGCEVNQTPIITSNVESLCAFKTFRSLEELHAYESELDNVDLQKIIGKASIAPFIQRGAFRTVLIHELGENCFFHGNGENIRYAMSLHPASAARKQHSILADFSGAEYLEIVVSDSGPGIINSLHEQVPKDFRPDYVAKEKKLSRSAQVITYALEFFSTSDPEKRAIRIKNLLNDQSIDPETIATGLWYVRNLARQYGGQLIVRTSESYLSLDYSKDHQGKLKNSSNLAPILGTHILFRVPIRKLEGPGKKADPIRISNPMKSFTPLVLQELKYQFSDSAEFIEQCIQLMIEKINTAVEKEFDYIIVVCDGLVVDNKAFLALLSGISVIPRRGKGLVLWGVNIEHVEAAEEQWRIMRYRGNELQRESLSFGKYSFVITSPKSEKTITFGNKGLDGTYYSIENNNDFFCVTAADLHQFQTLVFKRILEERICSPAVRHSQQYYYLIEKRYYTRDFFEIKNLAKMDGIFKILERYLCNIFENDNVGLIICISPSLYLLSEKLSTEIQNVQWVNLEEKAGSADFIRALNKQNTAKSIMILTDVICSGENVNRFLRLLPDAQKVNIACFVDGRKDSLGYILTF